MMCRRFGEIVLQVNVCNRIVASGEDIRELTIHAFH